MKHASSRILIAVWSLLVLLAGCLFWFTYSAQARESGQAQNFSEREVGAAVKTWVHYVTADARPDAVIERMEPHQVQGETVAYIAYLDGGGFALCGVNELVLPVYFYSPGGTYDPLNPDYQYILWEIGARLEIYQKALETIGPELDRYPEGLSERATLWQDLIAGQLPRSAQEPAGLLAEPTLMTLELTSHWHQGTPYNDQCPLHVPAGDRCLVGCVATTMSQIMYYWKWPNTGTGSISVNYEYRWRNNWDSEPLATDPNIPAGWLGRLQWTAAGGGMLQMNGDWDGSVLAAARAITNTSAYRDALVVLYGRLNSNITNWPADFGATTYQWNLMADEEGQLPQGGDAAVATLSHHTGIAVGMNYGIWGSGASTSHADNALEDHFRYDLDATYGARNVDTMVEEIQWLRPMAFRGDDPFHGGHAWVVYGYNKATDPARQFLMNLGWGGGGDGWYSCDNMDLDGDGTPDFNIDQHHVTRIAPEDVVRFVGDDSSGDGSPNDPYQDIEEAIAEAQDDATLIFKAGSINTFSADTLVIDRPLTLKGWDVIVRKQ
jgi:hypothetical protein